MSKITKVTGLEVLDSRGNPTVEAEVWLMRIQARISGHKMRCALRPASTPTGLSATPVSPS